MVTSPMPTVTTRRWWPIAVLVLVVLGVAGAAGAILWPREQATAAADSGPADAAPPPAPDMGPRPDVGRPKLTPQEVARLIEWARRAALDRRYIHPPKDNVKYLLSRVEQDYPGHPAAARLRKWVIKRLRRSVWRARRKRHYEAAERLIRTWQSFAPDSPAPEANLASLHIAWGRHDLGRRKYKLAWRHARAARKLLPESVAALELSGDVEMRRKRHAKAVKLYQEALSQKKIRRRIRRRLRKKLVRAKRRAK